MDKHELSGSAGSETPLPRIVAGESRPEEGNPENGMWGVEQDRLLLRELCEWIRDVLVPFQRLDLADCHYLIGELLIRTRQVLQADYYDWSP